MTQARATPISDCFQFERRKEDIVIDYKMLGPSPPGA